MHRNHRRKNPRPSDRAWNHSDKKFWLNYRVKIRRREDKALLKKTLKEEYAWEEIRRLEKPVDWWNID